MTPQAALQALILYLDICSDLPEDEIGEFKEKCIDLMTKQDLAYSDINPLIGQLNKVLSSSGQAAYPLFDESSERLQMCSGIIAFEHFLQQERKSQALTVPQQSELFDHAIHLWRDVASNTLSSRQGSTQFARLVKKANSHLPSAHQFPLSS